MAYTKRNDSYDKVYYRATTRSGEVINLTGATITFKMESRKGQLLVNAPATILNAQNGEMEYQFVAGDTIIEGLHRGEFLVVFADGKEKTFPEDGYIQVNISKDIDSNRDTEFIERVVVEVTQIEEFKQSVVEYRGEVAVNTQRVNDLITGVEQPSEVVDARLGYPLLRDKLQATDAQLAQTETQIENDFKVAVPLDNFGAVGDNITDDTQAFIDAIATGAQGILLGSGKTYKITSPIPYNKNLYLIGYNSRINVSHGGKAFTTSNNSRINLLGISTTTSTIEDAFDMTTTTYAIGKTEFINPKASDNNTVSIANFAKQGQTSPPIAFVIHHYTDGVVAQFDNVGQGNPILVLKNAQNPTRRPDLASDFVGTGTFLMLKSHNNATGSSDNFLVVDRNAALWWQQGNKPALFKNSKEVSVVPAFTFETEFNHDYIMSLRNAGQNVAYVRNRWGNTFVLSTPSAQTGGMILNPAKGDVVLQPIDSEGYAKLVDPRNSNKTRPIQGIESGATRPAVAFRGEMFFDSSLNKPIWRNASNNGWVDANGTTV